MADYPNSTAIADYVDPAVLPLTSVPEPGLVSRKSSSSSTSRPEPELVSRKSSSSSTSSLDTVTTAGRKLSTLEDRASGVRAKIAMFSFGTPDGGKSTHVKFQSSDDIGNLAVFTNVSLTRAHTQSDVRYEDCTKKQGSSGGWNQAGYIPQKGVSNLKPQNKNTSFRSMTNVSNQRETTKSTEDKAVSVHDLTQSSYSVIYEETAKPRNKIINSRSQSLNEIGALRKAPEIGLIEKSISSSLLGVRGVETNKKVSMISLDQRRRRAMSKLKGLVIPEGRESVGLENHDRHMVISPDSDVSWISNKLPNPPWKEKPDSHDFPKYSPAFKRKPFSLCNTKDGSHNYKEDKKQMKDKLMSTNVHQSSSVQLDGCEGGAAVSQQLGYKPTVHKHNSDENSEVRQEDSDNDSAVSSGRSSLSGRSSSPPTSPKHRKKQEDTAQQDKNLRILKKNSFEAINRENIINACKKRSAALNADKGTTREWQKTSEMLKLPMSSSSPMNYKSYGRPASRSSSFSIAERKKNSETSDLIPSRKGSNSSQDSLSRRNSKDALDSITSRRNSRDTTDHTILRRIPPETRDEGSRRGSTVTTPTGNINFPDTILDIEEKVAYMNDMVDRAASVTPTERRSLSRTNSIASERSTYSNRSSRNSSIVSEKAPFCRTSSMLSKDSAISEDFSQETDTTTDVPKKRGDKWFALEKKYSKSLAAESIENKISKLKGINEDQQMKSERPRDLAISQKKSSLNSPSAKNFKELAEKWQTFSSDTPTPTIVSPATQFATLPRKNSKEKTPSPVITPPFSTMTLPRKKCENGNERYEEFPWTSSAVKNSFYQVSGETEWSGFDMVGKSDIPDRKFSVPVFNESSVKLRDRRDNMPSRPSSLIESSEQKDLKIFEIGNLGDNNRMILNSNSTSRSSSQADLLDSTSVTSDTPKSPLPSSSSREILDAFSNRSSRRTVSVNDIRRAFEKAEQSLSNSGTPKRSGLSTSSSHNRMSSLDSTNSDESSIQTPQFHGSVSSLASGHSGLKDHYGSITSLASSTSMISPQVD